MGEPACELPIYWVDSPPTIEARGRCFCLRLKSGGAVNSFILDMDTLVALMGNTSKAYVERLAKCPAAQIVKFRRGH